MGTQTPLTWEDKFKALNQIHHVSNPAIFSPTIHWSDFTKCWYVSFDPNDVHICRFDDDGPGLLEHKPTIEEAVEALWKHFEDGVIVYYVIPKVRSYIAAYQANLISNENTTERYGIVRWDYENNCWWRQL